MIKQCATCKGTGEKRDNSCPSCDGSGYTGTYWNEHQNFHMVGLGDYLTLLTELEELQGLMEDEYIHMDEAYQFVCDNPPDRDI